MQLLTKEEKARLDEELKALMGRRPAIANDIAEAREKGDLKENADYHAARNELAMLEARIKNLEERLKASSVIDLNDVPEGMVFLGSTVKVKDVANGDEETFRIVGELGRSAFDDDSDVLEVSSSSPLGEALLRARIGDTVRVNLPRGERRYQILQLL